HSLLSCRVLHLDVHVDSEAYLMRNVPGSVSSPRTNGEKGLFRNQNAGFTALPSPVRREIGNRHIVITEKRHSQTLSCLCNEMSPQQLLFKLTPSAMFFWIIIEFHNQALLSGLAYCISSCSMILVNKFVLSSYGLSALVFLMLYQIYYYCLPSLKHCFHVRLLQNIVSVTIVSTLSLSGAIPTEPLTWNLIKVWLPVNIIFVGMLITSMFSLKYINVAMLTILKNVANVLTASEETYFFKKQHDTQVWVALMLMIIYAVAGGITELLPCFSFQLTLRHVMDSAKQVTKSGNLNELSNNNSMQMLQPGSGGVGEEQGKVMDDEVVIVRPTQLAGQLVVREPQFWLRLPRVLGDGSRGSEPDQINNHITLLIH
ncbi:hypothetical protein ACJX0J_039680, partial [Zea mays]